MARRALLALLSPFGTGEFDARTDVVPFLYSTQAVAAPLVPVSQAAGSFVANAAASPHAQRRHVGRRFHSIQLFRCLFVCHSSKLPACMSDASGAHLQQLCVQALQLFDAFESEEGSLHARLSFGLSGARCRWGAVKYSIRRGSRIFADMVRNLYVPVQPSPSPSSAPSSPARQNQGLQQAENTGDGVSGGAARELCARRPALGLCVGALRAGPSQSWHNAGKLSTGSEPANWQEHYS